MKNTPRIQKGQLPIIMDNNKILVSNIQRFSLHDGPGIRTTVFLKGCSLRCPWCANPENYEFQPQRYKKDDVYGTYGKWYDVEDLTKECLKDRYFYGGDILCSTLWQIDNAKDFNKLPGGVTFSGGEALLQIEELLPIIRQLHQNSIHVAVETSLFVPAKLLSLAMKHIDLFYVDVKILDKIKCLEAEKGILDLYLENLDLVMHSKCPVVIRIPVIGTYTDEVENRRKVKNLLSNYKDRILKVELIKEHNLGKSKYKSLGMEIDFHGVSDLLMEQYKRELEDLELNVQICKI